jgi:hypothetical protein
MLKSSGDKASHCFRTFWTRKLTDKCLPIWTLLYVLCKCILSTWLVSWVPQTLWEHSRVLPSSLNRRRFWSLWIADVLSYCTPISPPLSGESRTGVHGVERRQIFAVRHKMEVLPSFSCSFLKRISHEVSCLTVDTQISFLNEALQVMRPCCLVHGQSGAGRWHWGTPARQHGAILQQMKNSSSRVFWWLTWILFNNFWG